MNFILSLQICLLFFCYYCVH